MAPKSFAHFENVSKLRKKLEKLLIIFRQGVGKDLKQKISVLCKLQNAL
jgi:hypothetical protein